MNWIKIHRIKTYSPGLIEPQITCKTIPTHRVLRLRIRNKCLFLRRHYNKLVALMQCAKPLTTTPPAKTLLHNAATSRYYVGP